MPLISVNNTTLYYELHGPENADVIVLSNGIFMSTASWAYQIAALKKHFRVLVYDCRGMWKSDHPAGPYSMEQHADDLAGLLLGLGIEKAHIAGISYGGEISMIFAVKYSQMVRSLIVSSSVSQIDPLLETIGQSWLGAMHTHEGETLFKVTLPFNFSDSYIRDNQTTLANSMKRYDQMDFDSVTELMISFMKLNITDELKKITSPALVIVGEEDNLKSRQYSEIIAHEIPNSQFVIIPHAAHAVCLEKPGEFNSAVLGFVLQNCEVVA